MEVQDFKNGHAKYVLALDSATDDAGLDNDYLKNLRIGIWVYFFLLIFEGALRKWVLPGLSAPLLVVRDPVALYLLFISWKKGLFPGSGYVVAMFTVCILATITTLIVGHGSISVTLFGARILLIHFPIMFLIGRVFDEGDVKKLGIVMLYLSIPLIILMALQFYSPQSAWVNRGVGGDEAGSGFSGVMGFFRPSGPFSFTTGNSTFFSLLACFVIYFWVGRAKVNKLLLVAATLAVFASIPLSISRSLFFSIGISFVFMLFAISRNGQYLSRMLVATVFMIGLFFVMAQLPFFQTATKAFTARFENASSIEGGVGSSLVKRGLGGMAESLSDTHTTPFFGYGLGMGTNAGSALLTGDRSFLIAEGEWGRLIGEMGLALGLVVILIRIVFCMEIGWRSFRILSEGRILPWILMSLVLIIIPQGQWAQPTTLGFSTLIGGLVLASLNVVEAKDNEEVEEGSSS